MDRGTWRATVHGVTKSHKESDMTERLALIHTHTYLPEKDTMIVIRDGSNSVSTPIPREICSQSPYMQMASCVSLLKVPSAPRKELG